jgi:tRNA(adenine34) deaminase
MKKKKWVQNMVNTSTSPPEGIFTKDAKTIARVMAKPEVSPKGLGSAVRMIQYFINRGGKGLSKKRKEELEKAKRLLQKKMKASKKV